MSFDMPLKNRIVVPETHLPVANYIMVDSIDFRFIWMHIEMLDVIVHENRVHFIEFNFDMSFLFCPMFLVLLESLEISGLFCVFDLLLSVETVEHYVTVYSGIEGVL